MRTEISSRNILWAVIVIVLLAIVISFIIYFNWPSPPIKPEKLNYDLSTPIKTIRIYVDFVGRGERKKAYSLLESSTKNEGYTLREFWKMITGNNKAKLYKLNYRITKVNYFKTGNNKILKAKAFLRFENNNKDEINLFYERKIQQWKIIYYLM